MSDDLDPLARAMRQATPAPDPARKAANLALAQKNFATRQGAGDAARPTSVRPTPGPVRGVWNMLTSRFSTRGALGASTALVALGLVVFVNGPDLLPTPTLVDEPRNQPRAEAERLTERLTDSAAEMTLEAPATPQGRIRLSGQHVDAPPLPPAPARAAPASDHVLPHGIEASRDRFASAPENPLQITADAPVSTFSIDVDTASYTIVRRHLNNGLLPPKEAVRIEEMINYFPYDHPTPTSADGAPFRVTTSVQPTPWNAETQLLKIAIQGQSPEVGARPPLNLVLLVDTSGSMNRPDRLPLLQQSLAMLLPQLTDQDRVAIVTYAGTTGVALAPTPASDAATIRASLMGLQAAGGTAGYAGLQQAYDIAAAMADDGPEGAVSRVILATDGDFNVGLSDPARLTDFVAARRDSGTYLTVLGFGMGNLNDRLMQALAQNGNGQAIYIDTLHEARKALVDQAAGALFTIAEDVKIQVEFNPAQIGEYRLIGYETRILAREDFNNDAVDAGEIGAGHSVTALYEVTPANSPARLTDPLRYGAGVTAGPDSDELAFVRLRYKQPGGGHSQLIEQPVLPPASGAAVGDDARFAAAIAGFGQLLTGARYLGDWGWDEAIALAQSARGDDPFGHRMEAIQLMRLAQSLAQN